MSRQHVFASGLVLRLELTLDVLMRVAQAQAGNKAHLLTTLPGDVFLEFFNAVRSQT